MNTPMYCITTLDKWNASKEKGEYLDKSLETEGFIHCSYPHQLLAVANKHFKGMENLIILCINPGQLKSRTIDEDLSGLNEVYPHIYGPINIDAVVDVVDFQCDAHGDFILPESIKS